MKRKGLLLIPLALLGALLLWMALPSRHREKKGGAEQVDISNHGKILGEGRYAPPARVPGKGDPKEWHGPDTAGAERARPEGEKEETDHGKYIGKQGVTPGAVPGKGIITETVILPGTRIESDFVLLPGGKFKMGSPPNEEGRENDEGQVRDIELKPFRIGKREVTWGEFELYYGSPKDATVDGCTRPTAGREFLGQVGLPSHFQEAKRPVICLRWHSAMGYCCFVSRKTGQLCRLPTEAEWEYACRAGSEKPAPEGLEDQAWFKDNSQDRTHEVGEKKANAFGLYDMLGNVWEYCLEPYAPPDYGPVLRGGAWNTPAVELRAANRQVVKKVWYDQDPNRPRSVWWLTGDYSQGFRLVLLADTSDFGERQAYADNIQVTVRKQMERTEKIGDSSETYMRVSGEVKNAGNRILDELHVIVYYLTPKGQPHLMEVTGADKPGRATYTYVFPALVNSAQGGPYSQPLKPGDTRSFLVDIPVSYDDPNVDVDPDKFGGHAIGVVFSK